MHCYSLVEFIEQLLDVDMVYPGPVFHRLEGGDLTLHAVEAELPEDGDGLGMVRMTSSMVMSLVIMVASLSFLGTGLAEFFLQGLLDGGRHEGVDGAPARRRPP